MGALLGAAARHTSAIEVDRWLKLLFGDEPVSDSARADLLRHVNDVCQGSVKFFKADKGWGGIESTDTPFDVWVHYSAIEGSGYKGLQSGEPVEFRWEPAQQDSWRCRATWVRRLRAPED